MRKVGIIGGAGFIGSLNNQNPLGKPKVFYFNDLTMTFKPASVSLNSYLF